MAIIAGSRLFFSVGALIGTSNIKRAFRVSDNDNLLSERRTM